MINNNITSIEEKMDYYNKYNIVILNTDEGAYKIIMKVLLIIRHKFKRCRVPLCLTKYFVEKYVKPILPHRTEDKDNLFKNFSDEDLNIIDKYIGDLKNDYTDEKLRVIGEHYGWRTILGMQDTNHQYDIMVQNLISPEKYLETMILTLEYCEIETLVKYCKFITTETIKSVLRVSGSKAVVSLLFKARHNDIAGFSDDEIGQLSVMGLYKKRLLNY